jgi:hypothetical protein
VGLCAPGDPPVTNQRSSRAILAALRDAQDADSLELPDQRSSEAIALTPQADEAALSLISDVFVGTGLPDDPEKVGLILRLRGEVRHHWGTARDAFLSIGRALRLAEERLTSQESLRLRRGSDRLFPFSDSVATQLRKIAEAVDTGRISEAACPGSYFNAYQLAVLPDHHLQLAVGRNLVRPDVTRGEVLAFRAELKVANGPLPNRAAVHQIERERARLMDRRRALLLELIGIRRRIRELAG